MGRLAHSFRSPSQTQVEHAYISKKTVKSHLDCREGTIFHSHFLGNVFILSLLFKFSNLPFLTKDQIVHSTLGDVQ